MVENIHWLGHDAFRVEGEKRLYFDPYNLKKGLPSADIIFITHEHFDHCSPRDVERVVGPDTVIVTNAASAQKLRGNVQVVAPGDSLTVQGISVEVVPAYNINKFRSPGVPFHPKEAGHLGFIVTVGGQRLYHAGDTDFIPEMKSLQVDVALLPVSGIYVMTAEEAIEAAKALRPQVAIPMHYGAGVAGTIRDAERFRDGLKGIVEVVILKQE